ncbi:S-layer homology domain-containing protein [Paenibacillus glucanolyticus]|uniref:S-layer homology domain-containing protein n=1 Tax=Paenibacillus glucanolyticus TaxID=59843 RepID=UPI00096F2EFF|nr:S-layer homology domain-containing protein [Paenibacillus glucanolyticus]OMF76677.1 hypothetical protein BK142_14230 [Paenibacillus glucanolyticus]
MKKFKKFLSSVLVMSMSVSLFVGFGSKEVEAAVVRNNHGDSGLVTKAGGQITPSYDGSKLVYWSSNGDGPLQYYDIASKTAKSFSTTAGQRNKGVSFSKDGSKIVWVRGTKIDTATTDQAVMMYDTASGVEEKISGTDKVLGWPTIAPDASKVAYLAKDGSTSGLIKIYDVSAKTLEVLNLPTGSHNPVSSMHSQQFPTLLYTSDGNSLLISYTVNTANRMQSIGTYKYDIAAGTFATVLAPSSNYYTTNTYKGGQGIMSATPDGGKFIEFANTTTAEGAGYFLVDSTTGTRERLNSDEDFPQYTSAAITEDGKYATLPKMKGMMSLETKEIIHPEISESYYTFYGLSGDGQKLFSLTGPSKLDLVEYSLASLVNSTGFVAPENAPSITATVPADFETVKVEWVPNRTSTVFKLYNGSTLLSTFSTKELNNNPNGGVIYNLISYPYMGTLDLKIVESNGSGSVESNVFQLNVANLPAKLGNVNSYATSYVEFMGQKWSLVGDNYLLAYNPISTSTPYDKNSGSVFSPLDSNNIGGYLKAWFEGMATAEEQSMVSLHTWTITNANGTNPYTVRAKVGLLSSQEALALRTGKVLLATGSNSVWLINTQSGNGYNTMTMRKNGNFIETSTSSSNSTYIRTLPALYLEPTVSVSGGDGSFSNPFTLSTAPAQPQVPAVTNLVGVADSHEKVSLSWTAVPNATEYVVKRDGVVVGNPTTNSFSESGLSADTDYVYSVHAKVGTAEGSAATTTVRTKVQIPQVTNLKVVELRNGYINISFDPVPGASHYFGKRNGSNLGNTMNPSNMEHSGTMVPGTKYTYEISAVVNGVTGPAGTITITAPETVPVPQNVVGVSETPASVKLSWDPVPNATDYVIKKTVSKDILGTVKSTTFEQTGLTPSTEYSYFVQARINDAWSNEALVKVTTLDPVALTAPADFKVTGKTDKTVSLSWTAVPGATGYQIKDTATGAILYDGGAVTVATISGLNPDTDYTFEIVAKDGSAQTSPSSSVSVTTSSEVIPYPSGFTVTKVTYDQVDLIWNLVPNVDSYTVYRDGAPLDTIDYTFYTDNTVTESTKYIYSVVANKGGLSSQPAIKEVNTPARPVDGLAPGMPTGLKVVRAYADKVKLQWDMVSDATEYEVYRNGTNLVYKGPLTVLTDDTTGPEETYAYLVVAVNQFGKTAGAPVSVTTPAEAPQIIITPSPAPAEGTITFKFNVVEGAYEYHVERNPHWVYTANGDGTFHKTYENTATGEIRDYGNVTPEDGKLPFYEEGVAAGQNYKYEITAVRMAAGGTPEVVGGGEVSVDTPTDGSGVTVPDPNGNGGGTNPPTNPGDGGTNPGDGGGTTPPTNPGDGGNTGGGTNPGTGGNGSTTPPSGGNGGTTTPPADGNGGTTTPPTTGEDGKGTGEESGKGDSENTSSEPVDFKDVEENHFASDAIKELSSKGIITGYTDGTFAPNKTVTRAEFAIMLKRALGLEEIGGYTNPSNFKDFEKDSWYGQELAVALSNGITKGFTDNTYRPNEIIPREQAAIMVSNVMRWKGLDYEGTSLKFKDSKDIITWAVEDVKFAAEKGIIKGYSNGKFLPKANITRAETAVMIQRLLSLITE